MHTKTFCYAGICGLYLQQLLRVCSLHGSAASVCRDGCICTDKIPFKGRNAVFGIYVTALMIPSQITFIPLFIIMTNMHLTNSLNAFMLLQLFNAFAIFMMRQKMMTINDAYIEAAVIDGASMWRIFSKSYCP